MEHSLFLRQYKYEIPGPPVTFNGLPPKKGLKYVQQPALMAYFDFENGGFQLEGDHNLILTVNDRYKNSWLSNPNSRLFIDADMKPDIPAGPNDNLGHELLLHLKGSIYNGERRVRCSGLLHLNRTTHSSTGQWMIYCNLIDNDMNAFEIKLWLPVFTSAVQSAGNN